MTNADLGATGPAVYEFLHGRAAIVTEIYLPAKYAISPEFLAALDASLSPEKVKTHFQDNIREPQITELLPPELKGRYRELRDGVVESRRSFGGYSIYDLKGAWTTSKRIERDANLCVRLIDWPQPKKLFPADEVLCRRVIRTVFALRLHHITPAPVASIFQSQQEKVQEICLAVDTWIDQASFLLYGFVMFHLIGLTGGLESEILLTSHFAVVNQYGRQGEEESVPLRVECAPDKLELSISSPSPQDVVVICENAPANEAWGAYGYDTTVVTVSHVGGPSHVKGVAKFTVSPAGVGATTIIFGMADGKTCTCKVLVK